MKTDRTIAQCLAAERQKERSSIEGRLCKDGLDRVWKISERHSGFILKGKNTEAQIPYWTSYFLVLPNLELLPESSLGALSWKPQQPTLLEELLRLSVKRGDIVEDSQHWIKWVCKVGEYGLSLERYDDNGFIPQCSLGVLSLGHLIMYRRSLLKAAP